MVVDRTGGIWGKSIALNLPGNSAFNPIDSVAVGFFFLFFLYRLVYSNGSLE